MSVVTSCVSDRGGQRMYVERDKSLLVNAKISKFKKVKIRLDEMYGWAGWPWLTGRIKKVVYGKKNDDPRHHFWANAR
jgi:hypothetical protein